jgi:hypothetical protein
MRETPKFTTPEPDLILYAELSPAEIRQVQRRIKQAELSRVVPGVVTARPASDWPALIRRESIRLLAALYPGAVIGPRSAFAGGGPDAGIMYLTYKYTKRITLPGLTIQLLDGPAAIQGDMPMMGRQLFFPSLPRLLMENLMVNRGQVRKSVGQAAVEQRLIDVCEARGEGELGALRDSARVLAPLLGLEREFGKLNDLIGSILGTRKAVLITAAGKGLTAAIPYDAERLALFEKLASQLRTTPLPQSLNVTNTEKSRTHFAFLESYFSNFIEGTEFDVNEAREFVLQGKPITARPKDSHDVLGVFSQALDQGWANQILTSGEPVLTQLKARHAHQMAKRPEVAPGDFKTVSNRAGNTEFVSPRLVRGTLVEGSKILPTVPAGMARALLAMFIVAEVHPFNDGNGRLSRLVMNAELSVAGCCRIIIPTLFREEYLDCLRLLTREGDPRPYIDAMQKIQAWTASFDYEDIDQVIATMKSCNAFETSLIKFKLLNPSEIQ